MPQSRMLLGLAQAVSLAGYLAVGYLYVISGLAVPPAFLLLLWGVWIGLLLVALRRRSDVRYLMLIPLGAAVVWAAIVLGLGSILDWQA
ncbi:MAG TPA: hypothetical protein VG929_06420 [Actinomycetota bacterium]|nr:hypothetical protein [Actinomycetota bacterium]